MRTTSTQQLGVDTPDFQGPVICPAGEKIENEGVPACHCRIEDSVVSAALDPSSLTKFCLGDHTTCPTWRFDRDQFYGRRLKLAQETPTRREHAQPSTLGGAAAA